VCWQGVKSMDQSHSFTRCLQDVKIKNQDSVLTRCQKYGPKLLLIPCQHTVLVFYFDVLKTSCKWMALVYTFDTLSTHCLGFSMDQGHSFTRCLQDVKIKDQDSVLTRCQKYGPRPFIYKMSSKRQNKRPRQCVDKVSKVWTKAIRLQDVFKTSK
jgi:hypothetical protein